MPKAGEASALFHVQFPHRTLHKFPSSIKLPQITCNRHWRKMCYHTSQQVWFLLSCMQSLHLIISLCPPLSAHFPNATIAERVIEIPRTITMANDTITVAQFVFVQLQCKAESSFSYSGSVHLKF